MPHEEDRLNQSLGFARNTPTRIAEKLARAEKAREQNRPKEARGYQEEAERLAGSLKRAAETIERKTAARDRSKEKPTHG